MTNRMPAFRHPTCDVYGCGAHFYPRRRGDHVRADLIIPVPGRVEAVVYRRLGQDGSRTIDMTVYNAGQWTPAPLPRRPRKAYAAAVTGARRFLRTGVLVP